MRSRSRRRQFAGVDDEVALDLDEELARRMR
jgi:hypothetical protein